MGTILYNSATVNIIGHYPDGYKVDGVTQSVHPPIYELAYVETAQPTYDAILQDCISTWIPDYTSKTFTQTWFVSDKVLPTLEEAKAIKLKELKEAVKELYGMVQWYVEMYRAENTAIPATVLTKIKAIKTRYNAAKAIINGYTTVSDVLHWQVPQDQINTVKESLEAII